MYQDMMDTIGLVTAADPVLGAAMNRELGRQRQNIELIASENIVSPAVSIWMYDTMQKEAMTASIVNVVPAASDWAAIGVNVRQSADVYVTRIGKDWHKTSVERSEGWHELKWDYSKPGSCTLFIDGTSVGTLQALQPSLKRRIRE